MISSVSSFHNLFLKTLPINKKNYSLDKNEIILPPFTIFDVVNMVICAGGKPVFIDVNLENFSPKLEEIKKYYNVKTAGIILTHMHKCADEIYNIHDFCKNNKIKLINENIQ